MKSYQCWMFGDEDERLFEAEAPSSTVSGLKKAIKKNIPNQLIDVDAKDLDLYLAPQSVDLRQWTLEGKKSLSSRRSMAEHTGDGRWIVVVDAPTLDMKLTCWVQGEPSNRLFSIRFSRHDTVMDLQQAVKAERHDLFGSIPAARIELYKCDRTLDAHKKAAARIECKNRLPAASTLSALFSQRPPRERLHVVVGNPSLSGLRTTGEERDVLAVLAELFQHTTMISKRPTPSQAAKSNEYATFQAGSQHILDCRFSARAPVNTLAPPIQLFNPTFAFFSSKAFDPAYDVPDDFVRDTRKLVAKFTPIYDGEKSRQENLRPVMSKAAQCFLSTIVNSDKTSPDFVVQSQHNGLPSYLVIIEEMNEFGDGGSDPSVQASFSYLRLLSQPENKESCLRSCCPAFIVAHAGPWLSIMGGIILGRCVVQRLTDYVWIPHHSSSDDNHCLRIARMFYALREAIKRLDTWYSTLDIVPYDCSAVFHSRFWPSPTAYKAHGTGSLVKFVYQKPLEADATCVTYLAKTRDDGQDIVVKFVTSYGAEAHEYMASGGFAPRLLYHGEINVCPDMPSYGDLRMVVMEYVNGLTLQKAFDSKRVPSRFESDLRRAFRHLHDGGYVFGDLRMPNVMVLPHDEGTSKSTVQLIDFDWAGREGNVKYPISINSSTITWPDGVTELVCIKKEHDIAMLDSLCSSII